MTTEKLIELVGIWFTGIATFSATLVALFLPKLYRPRLSVSCNKDGIGSSSYVFIDRSGSPPMEELWVKVGVKNKSGLNAEHVQLRLIMAHNRGMAGRQGYKSFSSWWLKVSALNAMSISIPPKYTQYYDLCYLVADRDGSSVSAYIPAVRYPMRDWNIEKEHIERDPNRKLEPRCEYDLVFAVSGKNTHAGYFQISISYDVPDFPRSDGFTLSSETAIRRAIRVGPPTRVSRQVELDKLDDV